MAATDLTEIQSSQSVKIIGSDATGLELTPVSSTANGEIQNADLLNQAVVQSIISVPTGTIVAMHVGSSNLANRKSIIIASNTANMVYGFSATLTPFPFPVGTVFSLSLGPNITLYVGKTGTGAGTVSVAELA